MKKKVINGWVSRSCTTPGGVIGWHNEFDEELVTGPLPIFRLKGKKCDWGEGGNIWPPKKVKITIELED